MKNDLFIQRQTKKIIESSYFKRKYTNARPAHRTHPCMAQDKLSTLHYWPMNGPSCTQDSPMHCPSSPHGSPMHCPSCPHDSPMHCPSCQMTHPCMARALISSVFCLLNPSLVFTARCRVPLGRHVTRHNGLNCEYLLNTFLLWRGVVMLNVVAPSTRHSTRAGSKG